MRLSLLMSVSFRKAFYIVSIGCGLHNILPFRLGDIGDILKIYFVKRFYEIEMSYTLAATLMERYFDLIMLLILEAVALFSVQYGLEVNVIYLINSTF
ncbi:hypothetical protein B1F79_00585 [Coxiella-like endosymbiont of Rhipicephalus sanguineus]|uniref:lysylphosphatidylglycerol synthase domain-containing protein n=1 Tax=Coxiella-like endosymbiont of Rhipicephalus sanguineus TaxID=1955402 RepID=UPI00203BA198|nr:lysylphosphatidylglycerol synthase domain-containing protein [Coxiella-like endosymbiont of Rhipicephalus sanguineus]MBT8506267.1 hypothetical protein [Coxiella-like endosymbiont of Rhipicephalus sanguineus]